MLNPVLLYLLARLSSFPSVDLGSNGCFFTIPIVASNGAALIAAPVVPPTMSGDVSARIAVPTTSGLLMVSWIPLSTAPPNGVLAASIALFFIPIVSLPICVGVLALNFWKGANGWGFPETDAFNKLPVSNPALSTFVSAY